MAKKKGKRKPEKVETENFWGRDHHYSIGYRRVTVITKEGEKFEGTVVYCDYDRLSIELESDESEVSVFPRPSVIIDWDDVKKFVDWGWSKFWLKMENGDIDEFSGIEDRVEKEKEERGEKEPG